MGHDNKDITDMGMSLREKIKDNWVVAALGTISMVSGMIWAVWSAANPAYEEWHRDTGDKRWVTRDEAAKAFALKGDVLIMSEAQGIRDDIEVTKILQKNNSNKIDFLVKSEAVRTVVAIKQELSYHKIANDGSVLWQRELDDIQSRLANAENYRDCLFAERTNCDASKVW